MISRLLQIIEGHSKNLGLVKISGDMKKLSEMRMEICNECPHKTTFNNCSICGCYLPAKTNCKDCKCPKDYW